MVQVGQALRDPVTMKTIACLSLLTFLGFSVDDGAHTRVPRPVPCTGFSLKVGDQILFGRNYDWFLGSGFLTINKRGLSKTSPTLKDAGEPARWKSRFGSVTFNQYGREFPAGGINEAGLVIETTWLSGTRYPDADRRPAVPALTWVQYQLDTARGIDDVVANATGLRIHAKSSAPLHFLLCDRTGCCAVIEFLKGKMVVHRGDEMPYSALANTRYLKSVGYLKLHEGFGGDEPIDRTRGSLDRFCRAAEGVRSYSGKAGAAAVAHAFAVLKDVRQAGLTQWSIVYDVANLRVHWKTSGSPAVKFLDLGSCDFSNRTPCAQLDVQTAKSGDVRSRFAEYSTEANLKQIRAAFRTTPWPEELKQMKEFPDEVLVALANYPSRLDRASGGAPAGDKAGK